MKHTPGPWQHYDFGTGRQPVGPYILAVTVDPHGEVGPIRGYTVCCGVTGTGASTYWPAQGVGGRPDEECRANARLIAAAPDLLAALRECHEFLVATCRPIAADDHLPSMLSRGLTLEATARATIAKAEGGGA
jgi:hypothetical protein